jgi:F-type H+-transporting ATPase subunit delta
MSDFRVASRYAKSLLGLADEKGVLEQVQQDMALFARVCHENPTLVAVLKNPIIKQNKKLGILNGIFSGKVNGMTLAIFEIITRKNRSNVLPSVAEAFKRQYQVMKGIEPALVVTPVAIDEALRNEFKSLVKKISGKTEVDLKEKIDTSLIGGYLLRIGDRQVDETLKGKLKDLERKFSENPYIKAF